MKIQIFTLCEYVQVQNGKSTIIGTFNRIVAPAYPFVVPDMYLVLKLAFDQDAEETISISLREKSTGKTIISTGNQTMKIVVQNGRQTLNDVVYHMNNLALPNPGEYEVVFKYGTEEHVSPLYVDLDK